MPVLFVCALLAVFCIDNIRTPHSLLFVWICSGVMQEHGHHWRARQSTGTASIRFPNPLLFVQIPDGVMQEHGHHWCARRGRRG